MKARTVSKATELWEWFRDVRPCQDIHSRVVQGADCRQDVFHVPLWIGSEAAAQGIEPCLAQFAADTLVGSERGVVMAND